MTSLCPAGPIVLSEDLESITEKSDKLIAYPMRCVCVLNIEQANEPHPNSHCHSYTTVSHITKIDDDDQVFLLDFIHDNSSNAVRFSLFLGLEIMSTAQQECVSRDDLHCMPRRSIYRAKVRTRWEIPIPIRDCGSKPKSLTGTLLDPDT
ncbi:uncharacterized protein RAG0_01270 [Rhynchosporium agropyri]|uniref:Uncharacterized protein n=1 Tax=Rhynchosporium agropyri TaxID=914238 RepID=A0A1E1JW89_9HELO|nr:uncharacterized protein RAG0_01270 [Rhynchosporium agropyri]